MGAEVEQTFVDVNASAVDPHAEARSRRRRGAACLLRLASHFVLFKLVLVLGSLVFFVTRGPVAVTLAPFEHHQVHFCPKWFRGVEVVAPYPANEWVTVHRIKGQPNLTDVSQTYKVGYNASLFADSFGRTHTRSYFFSPESLVDIKYQSSAPVKLFVVHPEHREEREVHRRSEKSEEEQREQKAPMRRHREASTEGELKVKASGGRYDFVFSLPRNATEQARATLQITTTTKTLNTSRSCPIFSSLASGRNFVRVRKHSNHHVVLQASGHARSSSVVYVQLVPRGSKFGKVALILFGVWAILRLASRFLRAHAGPKGKGQSCFWSRICRRQPTQAYSPVMTEEPAIAPVAYYVSRN